MRTDVLGINWVDLAIAGLLVVGLFRGRKRGMSEEILDVLKWTLILLVGSLVYEPAGRFLASNSMFSLLSCYVTAYTLFTLLVILLFAYIRRRVGTKLVSSDTFGRGEYYLGMMAGIYRYVCVILVCLAFLNARYYSAGEIQAQARFQQDNFGDIRFPTLGEFQRTVFSDSLIGRFAHDFLAPVLIRPTAPSDRGIGGGNSVFSRRNGEVYQLLDKR